MATIADTLRAIEARAQNAIVQELHLMMQEVQSMRAGLALDEDRSHADALVLKLERMARDQVCAPQSEDTPEFLQASLRLPMFESPPPARYRVFLYTPDYGDLDDVVTVETFDAGVQLVRERLARDHFVVTANWIRNEGDLSVASVRGMTLATVQADTSRPMAAPAEVLEACTALRTGDASRICDLFSTMLQAA